MDEKINILIAEDSPTQAIKLQCILETHGYDVSVAQNGVEALECLKKGKPSLVISDIEMPQMDGYDLCRNIRSKEELKDIPVILLTGLSDIEDVVKALSCGADNFVTKPYNEDFLISRIEAILVNQEMRKTRISDQGIQIVLGGRKHIVSSDSTQMVDLLLSTYENAIQKNKELKKLNDELTDMHRELEKRNVDLERLNEQKNHFLGMAAHDLRNPLGAIFSFSEVLLEEASGTLAQDQLEIVSTIKSSSEFMLQMVNDFLNIAQIESGKLDLDLKPTDIKDVIERNVSLNSVFAIRKQIELIFHHEGDLPVMLLDSGKTQQVLNNLITNAIKYSHAKTMVQVIMKKEEDHVVISVTDQGQGIPADELDKLFKPFVKTSVKTTAGESSTGLGLAIARKIVEGHKGKIWVESTVGEGSTFNVSLPIVEPSHETDTQGVQDQAGAGASTQKEGETIDRPSGGETVETLHILLAEDNPVNQRLVVRLLEKNGHKVLVAGDGKEAVNALEKEPFDLILMDVQMPEMDGFEATQAIRQKEKETLTHVPIVAMTGHAMKGDSDRCLKAGMDAYISKPVRSQQLFALVGDLLKNNGHK